MPRRAPTRLSEDLNMVAKKVADTSPDVPAAKRAKILSEDDGNEGEVGIAERVGGENGRQPQLAVSNAAGSNGPEGANAPDEGAEKGEDIVENVMRDENDVGAQEPEEQDENPPASPRSEPAANAFGPGGFQEDAPEEGEKRVPIGDASADAAGSPVEPAKEPEGNTVDQEQSAGAQPVVAANSADASDPSDAAAPDNTLRTAQHAILLRQQAIKYKGCCQVDDCLNPRKQPTANSRMPLTCAEHNGMLSLTYGGEASRECQACRAFHPVSAFDRDNKTCETRLLRKKLRYRAKTLQQRDEHRGQVGKQKARRHEAALQAVAAATAQPGVGVGLGQFSHLQGPAGFMLPFGGKFPGVADKDGGAGALAAPITFVEERTVGPSLGAENIRLGMKSVQVGLGLVVVFMMFYYRVFGIAAVIALAGNLVLLVGIMSLLGATLTLPGIAGIVLTVGMAVDANVLIFARIREEIRSGAPPQTAITQGFDRAIVTILDANITTLIVAIILYAIGTGPIKGFAVTLSVGIVTSMFSSIMGTRALINLIYGGRRVKKLAIGGVGRVAATAEGATG